MEMQEWLDCPIARATRGLSRPSLDARSLGQTKPTLAVEVGGKKRRLPAHVSSACATLTFGLPRVAHLAERAVDASPRWTRAVEGSLGHTL